MADKKPVIRVFPDPASVAAAAADLFARETRAAAEARGTCTVALSGGSTPEALYRLLADRNGPYFSEVPWAALRLFWGDERHVGPDDAESNYRMTRLALLEHAPIPSEHIFRVPAENPDAARVAADYQETLAREFGPGALPRFDLIMLGMGPDGHTASLFPDSPALAETSRQVAANWVEKFKQYRITFSFPVINHARLVLFLVTGKSKADVLPEVLSPAAGRSPLPAARIAPEQGRLVWMVDEAAAAHIDPGLPGVQHVHG